ncbi:hypothetical protein M406DRAFT_237312, partial [Cryphonectria parasitica EP155]
IPAPYGGACTNCAKAKCRCTYRAGEDTQRCYRLGKQCTLQVSARRWNDRQTNSSRIAHLEQKVEDLLGLLKSQTAAGLARPSAEPGYSPGPGRDVITTFSSASSTAHSLGSLGEAPSEEGGVQDQDDLAQSLPPNGYLNRPPFLSEKVPASLRFGAVPAKASQGQSRAAILTERLTPDEAEQNLVEFRAHYGSACPFVYLPPEVTSQQLLEEKPFTWLNIMAVTTKSLRQQQLMHGAVRQQLADEMVLANEKSIDLLYGLLIYISWSHTHRGTKPHLTLMGTLVQSLVYDLVLHKPLAESSNVTFFTNYACAEPPEKDRAEANRAILGAYLITSIVATSHKRLEPLRWTPFLDECLESLSQEPEWVGDQSLVLLVKYQLVIDQMCGDKADQAPQHPQSRGAAPPTFYIDALRAHVQNIGRQTPVELESEENVLSSSLYAELVINESAIHPTTDTTTATPTQSPDLQRHALLASELSIVRRWLDMFFAITPSRYWALGFSFWSQLAHMLIVLFRLTVRVDPAWDPAAVHAALDISVVCDRLAGGFAEASAARWHDEGEDNEDDVPMDFFAKCHQWILRLRERWLAEIEAVNVRKGGGESVRANGEDYGATLIDAEEVDFDDGTAASSLAMSLFAQPGGPWLTDVFTSSWD